MALTSGDVVTAGSKLIMVGIWPTYGGESLETRLEHISRIFFFIIQNYFSKYSKKLDDGWPESEKGKDVDVKYIEERRRCEKISEERMNI